MLLLLPLALLAALRLPAPATATTATPHHRSYLYTGGHYAPASDGSLVFRGQMYVEQLTPAAAPPNTTSALPPIILVHGGGQTGTNFLTTPDGRPGWSSYFLARGHAVYLVDAPFRGRSPWLPLNASDTLTAYSTLRTAQRFTAPERHALYPQAALHTQWPGPTGEPGDPVFDAYYASTVPIPYAAAPASAVAQTAFRAGIADLLRRIGRPSFVVGHSQGGTMAWQAADAAPGLVAGLVALEPSGPPFGEEVFGWGRARDYGLSDAPLAWVPALVEGEDVRAQFELARRRSADPAVANCTLQAEGEGRAPPRRLVEVAKVPVLLVTAEASYHEMYDWCTVEFLRQAGVEVDFVRLLEKGVRGNAHLFFMEKNSDESAAVVNEWFQSRLA